MRLPGGNEKTQKLEQQLLMLLLRLLLLLQLLPGLPLLLLVLLLRERTVAARARAAQKTCVLQPQAEKRCWKLTRRLRSTAAEKHYSTADIRSRRRQKCSPVPNRL